jgi:hypothetical protein
MLIGRGIVFGVAVRWASRRVVCRGTRARVEAQELVGVRVESNNIGSQFGFAFFFLVGSVHAVEIGILWFPGKVEMRPKMMQDV